VSVFITDDRGICRLNSDFRGIAEPTDVLSFPMQDFSPPGWVFPGAGAIDAETGLVPLGEIVLSAERVDRQAQEFDQSRDCETAYLVVHSVLHLLGYDHVDEAEGKREMRDRERAILARLVIHDF
jgi:probable rRNA maturation factor